jgi:polyhydroxyalkanoate synthesis regulator phasin
MENGFSKFLSVIKTSVLAGLGASVITKEKAEKAVDRLVEQGKLTIEEAQQLVDELLATGKQKSEEMQNSLNEAVHKALESADIARLKDVQSISQRLEKIEQRVEILENALDQMSSSEK